VIGKQASYRSGVGIAAAVCDMTAADVEDDDFGAEGVVSVVDVEAVG
jgi:hypothetical protein